MRSTRGEVVTAVLIVCGLLGATQLVPNWRVSQLFAPKPPMVELAKAEAVLAAAKSEAAAAQKKLEDALAEQKRQTGEQGRYSQQMIAGIPMALRRAPASPEVILALSLAERAAKGLTAAIGDLPADRQAEITAIVEGALSAKQAEIDAAKAQLAIRDHDLAVSIEEKKAVEAKLPALQAKVDATLAAQTVALTVVATKTQEVVAYANKAAEAEKEAGSAGELIKKLAYVILGLGVLYALIHFILPSLSQEFPANVTLTRLNKAAKSIASSHL